MLTLGSLEVLYKRYLKKGDLYIHADLPDAASLIVKNKPGMMVSPIPPSTLSQAGTLAVATSTAWDAKAVMSAWWVKADEVSKIASSGDYLTIGSFNITGHKNFLPPAQLLLGFGLLFRVSEKSKIRHLKHRLKEGLTSPHSRAMVVDDEAHVEGEGLKDVDRAESELDELDNLNIHNIDHIDEHDQATEMSRLGKSDGDGDDDNQEDIDPGIMQENPLQPANVRYSVSQAEDEGTVSHPVGFEPTSSGSSGDFSEAEYLGDARDLGETPLEDNQKRHCSVKEHHTLRQGPPASANTPSGPTSGLNSEETSRSSTPANDEQTKIPDQSSNKPQAQPVRGKHGKRNKFKNKYAYQDEEDRTLAMRLLGSAAAQERAAQDAATKASREQELAKQKERRQEQHVLAAQKGREAEKTRRLNFEDVGTLEDGEASEVIDFDTFIGAPLPGDEILDTLVVCGPWDALGSRCRWKVKLQPGTMKKGKAVKEILHTWRNVITDREKKRKPGTGEVNQDMVEEDKVRKREAELIRAIREPEVIGTVPVGKVRIVTGVGQPGSKAIGGAGKGRRGGRGSKRQR